MDPPSEGMRASALSGASPPADPARGKHGLLRDPGLPVPEVCLTFDNGPDPEVTPAVPAVLARRRIRATFFVAGARFGAGPAPSCVPLRRGGPGPEFGRCIGD